MSADTVPVQVFVTQQYHTPKIQRLVENWRVEAEVVVEKVIDHFREMGIFVVPMSQQRLVQDSIIAYIKTSPELTRLVLKSRQDELKRQVNRHAD